MKMTSRERVQRIFDRKDVDRLPIIDIPWAGTLDRWHREGLPEDVDWRDYFDIDKEEKVPLNVSPRYPVQVLEETDEYQIVTTEWGVTFRCFKHQDSTPELSGLYCA